jgi:hypothetical protein
MPYKGMYRDLATSPTGFMRHYVAMHGRAHELKRAPVGEPAKLPSLSELIKTSLPRPAVMVTLLRRHFSGATVEKLEQTFAVPAKFIAAAAQAYRRMYAKQSVQTQKRHFDLPQPPRTKRDQREYFRILDHTFSSAAKSQNRPALSAVAEALIQRTGPRTGQIYFGTKGRDVELILKGLVLLGIDASEMTLVVRRPVGVEENPDFVVPQRILPRKWGSPRQSNVWSGIREDEGALLRLDVKNTSRDVGARIFTGKGASVGSTMQHGSAWLRVK